VAELCGAVSHKTVWLLLARRCSYNSAHVFSSGIEPITLPLCSTVWQCCCKQAAIVHLHTEIGAGSDPVSPDSDVAVTPVDSCNSLVPSSSRSLNPLRFSLAKRSKPASCTCSPALRALQLLGSLLLCPSPPRCSLLPKLQRPLSTTRSPLRPFYRS
jgi:hypothetical protein